MRLFIRYKLRNMGSALPTRVNGVFCAVGMYGKQIDKSAIIAELWRGYY
ncbi:MAG: hypothetical protein IAE95_00615 [Chitinophagaceae bacterium]|nr:hypothetical protein [Chitinophagaceae bacterium]